MVEQIVKEAKEKGIWKGDLDGNRELFYESKRRFLDEIKRIQSMIDKDEIFVLLGGMEIGLENGESAEMRL